MALDSWTFADGPWNTGEPIGDYTYREGKDSGTGTLGESPSATRIFLVDWEFLAEFTNDLIGYAEAPDSVGGKLKRTLPEEHPDLSYFYATDVTYKGMGVPSISSGGSKSEWPIAQLTVTYRPLPYAVYADGDISEEVERFVSIETQSQAEYLQANNVGMQFVSRTTEKNVMFSPGKIVPSVIQSYTWHRLPAPASTDDDALAEFKPPNLELYTRYIGYTNYTTFDNHPPRTMVLINVTSERLMPNLSDGLYQYNITYTFDVRNHGEDDAVGSDEVAGVDYIYDLANGRWDLITTTGTTGGQRLFEATEFANLFKWGVE